MARNTTFLLGLFFGLCCGCGTQESDSDFQFRFSLDRQYTGTTTNVLSMELIDPGEEKWFFSVDSELADVSIPEGVDFPLETSSVSFTYQSEGVYAANFKVRRENGSPFIHQILTWEYSTEVPPSPLISFATTATRSSSVQLLVSANIPENIEDIWISGDVSKQGKTELDGEGYWESFIDSGGQKLITLAAGDGYKNVTAKFRNVFGNVSEESLPAQILLKQNPPENCRVAVSSLIVSDNNLRVKLFADDEYPTYYSVFGDLEAVVNQTVFESGSTVTVKLEPTVGEKNIEVTITDVAGNICLSEQITVTVDPTYRSEGIFVQDKKYWTDDENINVTVNFDHFDDQEPIQIKITGDVTGPNTFAWITPQDNLPIKLNPSTGGSRTIFAQYKDVNGTESYLISKRIYLKPAITLQDAGAPMKNVIVSNILDAPKLSISGCVESYVEVAWQASYSCNPNASQVSVTWHLRDDTTVVKSATP